MFEKFVQEKINFEKDIINSIEDISRESLIKSHLSEFSKNYLLSELNNTIDKNELVSKIEKSVKLYFNYTIRPKWTLQTYLFSNYESRPPEEISKKLEVFPFYKFYIDAIKEMSKDDFPIFITKSEVIHVIDETNKVILERLTNQISNLKIKNFFFQLFKLKYEDEYNYNLESSIPYSFIKIFLQDKSYLDLEKKFIVINDITDESEISLKDIIKVFTNKYKVSEREDIVKKVEIITIPNEPEKLVIDLPPEGKKEEIISRTEDIYSEELIQANKEKKLINEVEIDKPVFEDDNKIKSLFSDKQLQKILDEVYNSDLMYREKSFEKLNNMETWTQASNHLKEIFQNNRVDIYNKEVVTFVDKLNEYFVRSK